MDRTKMPIGLNPIIITAILEIDNTVHSKMAVLCIVLEIAYNLTQFRVVSIAALLAFAQSYAETKSEVCIQVVDGNKLRVDICNHEVAAEKQIYACGVEVEHPAEACSVCCCSYIDRSLEPLDRRYIDVTSCLVPLIDACR